MAASHWAHLFPASCVFLALIPSFCFWARSLSVQSLGHLLGTTPNVLCRDSPGVPRGGNASGRTFSAAFGSHSAPGASTALLRSAQERESGFLLGSCDLFSLLKFLTTPAALFCQTPTQLRWFYGCSPRIGNS